MKASIKSSTIKRISWIDYIVIKLTFKIK